MNRKLALMAALGAALGAAGVASAQVALPAVPGPSAGVTTTWSGGYNLGPVPAGSYTSALVITNWDGSTAAANQWSSEARASLHGAALSGTPGTGSLGPSGSGTVHYNAPGAAVGSAGNINAVNNIFWFGNMGTAFNSDGTNDLYLSHRQTFNGVPAVTWSNMRVVLNPTVTNGRTLGTGVTAPGTFSDLGTLAVGNTNLTLPVNNTSTGAAGISWFRFQVNSNVDASSAFDIFSSDGPNGVNFDTRVSLFRNTGSGLFPVASTDDMNGATNRHGGVTFGSSDPTALGRDMYEPATAPGFLNGRGGTLTLAAMDGFGYFANTPGAGTLSAGTEYFLAVSHWSTTAPTATLVGGGTALNMDELGVTLTGTVNAGIGAGSATALGTDNVLINFRSIPTPGAMALLGLGGLVAARRRRA
ncbi:MAG: PEP-CTERM sorting domain-containing protein [Phycisphaeraceae bacterium]|nr:PEP-CTERM sorting domain-containing protein [Phycisphaeraceae bacterium]